MATPFKLKNGSLLLSTEAPGGLYNATQLKKIAALCDSNTAIVKATEDQRLALFVAEDRASAVAAQLREVGLGIRHYQDGLHQPTACVGEMCPDHEQDALGAAMQVSQAIANLNLSSPLKIGINGCSKCCVPTHTLDISIIGDSQGYSISLGGKNTQIPEIASFMAEGVPAEKLADLISKVVTLYRDSAETGESLQDVMDRCGVGAFVEALRPYSQDAADPGQDPLAAMGSSVAPAAAESTAIEGMDDELLLDDLPTLESTEEVELGAMDDISLGGDSPGLIDDLGQLEEVELNVGGSMEVDIDPSAFTSDTGMGDVPIEDSDVALDGQDEDLEVLAQSELAEPAADQELEFGEVEGLSDLELSDTSLEAVMVDADLGEDLIDGEGLSAEADIEDLSDLDSLEVSAEDMSLDTELEETAVPDSLAMPDTAAAAMATSDSIEVPGDDLHLDNASELPEASEDLAQEFEEKFASDIDVEMSMPMTEDENMDDRAEAVNLVAESAVELPDVDLDQLEPELLSPEQVEPALAFEKSPRAISHAPERHHLTPIEQVDFAGLDTLPGGLIGLNFSNGMQLALDPSRVAAAGSHTIQINGQAIMVIATQAGYTITIDGMTVSLPRRAA